MQGKVGQAYLFLCPDNTTSNALVMEIAKLILCENKNCCGVCSSCIKVQAGTHPDILIYPKGKNFVVDDANSIYDTALVKPVYSGNKIYIINDFDEATEQAQNKMLKVIEEPPNGVIFLFTAKQQTKILPTILSRVQKRDIDKVSLNLLEKLLDCDESTKKIALSAGDGFIGKTLSIASEDEFIKNYSEALNLIENLKKSEQIPYFSSKIAKNKANFEETLLIISELFRDMLMAKLEKCEYVKYQNAIELIKKSSNDFSVLALVTINREINKFKQKLYSNVNLVTLCDNMLLMILEVKFKCK